MPETNTSEQDSFTSVSSRPSIWSGLALEQLLRETLGAAADDTLLSDDDVQHYRAAFAATAATRFGDADRHIAKLVDRRLVGHLQFMRYMHPTAYRATYPELQAWLAKYADLPGASEVHSLALKRQPKNQKKGPDSPVAAKAFRGGLSAAALQGTGGSATSWRVGLAAWQKHDYAAALSNFQALARNEDVSPWEQSAGAYWAARSLTRLGRPAEVSRWLERAAAHPRTFYGLIAARQLGTTASLNWSVPSLEPEHLLALTALPAGKRALALLQIGKIDLAEDELRRVHPKGNDNVEAALVSLAYTAGMPNLALRVGTAVPAPDGALYDAALYPMPRWEPKGGFTVDRALIFALIRQESRFEPEARSHAGATGLMQLMPMTASYVAGRKFDRSNLGELANPELNLTLGQRYVSYLLEMPDVGDNLFTLLAAYNSGPTQVGKWMRDNDATRDPLLFIELLPAAETRDFIERVVANYWIYQLQLGQDTPSLDRVVAGDWPVYAAQDLSPVRVADNAPLN